MPLANSIVSGLGKDRSPRMLALGRKRKTCLPGPRLRAAGPLVRIRRQNRGLVMNVKEFEPCPKGNAQPFKCCKQSQDYRVITIIGEEMGKR